MKLFRNIRKKLSFENKAAAYLRYAIGEIVLVVIGILIALQINNWNEHRKDHILEETYLRRLKGDVNFDIMWINRYMLGRYDQKIKSLTTAKAYYQDNYRIKDTLQFLKNIGYGGVFGNVDWNLNENTYNELINTGNLTKIESDSLRTMISNYYESIKAYRESSKNYKSGYVNYINSLRPFNPANPEYISGFDKKYLLEHLKTDEFYRLINLEITLGYRVHGWASTALSNAKDLLKNINRELDN